MVDTLVSIITPAYNAEAYLQEAIASVQAQGYTNWEMIIVDDCSSDGTQRIARRAAEQDARIRYERLVSNSGAAVARNRALELARGRYVAFLDADDRWKSGKLERQLACMKENGYGFTFTGYEIIGREGNGFIQVPKSQNYVQALKNTAIGCLTVIIDRSKSGDFQMPNYRRGQDHLTWLMLLKGGMTAYGLNENLAEYRKTGNGSLSGNKLKALKRQWHNYRKVEGIRLLPCCYYYLCYIVNALKKHSGA